MLLFHISLINIPSFPPLLAKKVDDLLSVGGGSGSGAAATAPKETKGGDAKPAPKKEEPKKEESI